MTVTAETKYLCGVAQPGDCTYLDHKSCLHLVVKGNRHLCNEQIRSIQDVVRAGGTVTSIIDQIIAERALFEADGIEDGYPSSNFG